MKTGAAAPCQTGRHQTPHLRLVDTDDHGDIDDVADPQNAVCGLNGASFCVTISYTARPQSRHDDDEIDLTDSKFQATDLTLQIGDLTLQIGDLKFQIGDLTLQIGDFTLGTTPAKRRLDVTTRPMADLNVLSAIRCFKSTIPSVKSAIRSVKSTIRNVPRWHTSVAAPSPRDVLVAPSPTLTIQGEQSRDSPPGGMTSEYLPSS
jgi:hypothetical protein